MLGWLWKESYIHVPQQTFSGKTGVGSASLGGSISVTDIECVVTAVTSAKVRSGPTVDSAIKLGYAGSYGLTFHGAHGNLVTTWHSIMFDHQNLNENGLVGATHVFWMLKAGVTATIYVNS